MREVELQDIAEIIAGQSPKSKFYNEKGNGVPFFQGKADFGKDYPTVTTWCTKPKKMAKKGDILFSVRAPVGPTNIADLDCCIGRGLSAIRPRDDIDRSFLRYYFKKVEKKISDRGRGSTFNSITQKDLKALNIPLPSLSEQKAIVAKLDRAQRLIDIDREMLNKYDELIQSVFLEMFGDPVTNPMGWRKLKLKDFCEFENGDRSSNYPSGDDITDSGKLFLSSGDIQNGKFSFGDSRFISEEKFESLKRGKCKPGDVLMTLRGSGTGKTAVFDCQYNEGFINAQMVIIRPDENCLSQYLVRQLNCPPVFKRLINLNSGSAQPQLSASSVKEFEVLVPSIDYQQEFERRSQRIEFESKKLKASQKKSEELFSSLMQEAFG